MIRLDENYVIDVDKYGYTAKIDLHKKNKKDEPMYKVIGYYSSLSNAIQGVFDIQTKSLLSEGEKSLYEAVNALHEVKNKMIEVIDTITKIK